MRTPTPEEMQRLRISTKGFNRALLAEYGIPWPPPSGWRKELLKRFWIPPATKIVPREEAKKALDDQFLTALIAKTKEGKLTWNLFGNCFSTTISKTQVLHLSRNSITVKTPSGCRIAEYSHILCRDLYEVAARSRNVWSKPLEEALEALGKI